MRTGRIHLISKDRSHFLFHPNDSILQAYVDEELESSAFSVIVGHLGHCHFCQRQVSLLKEAFQRFQGMQAPSDPGEKLNLAEGLVRVQKAIQDWREENQTMDPQRWETVAQLGKYEGAIVRGNRRLSGVENDPGPFAGSGQNLGRQSKIHSDRRAHAGGFFRKPGGGTGPSNHFPDCEPESR